MTNQKEKKTAQNEMKRAMGFAPAIKDIVLLEQYSKNSILFKVQGFDAEYKSTEHGLFEVRDAYGKVVATYFQGLVASVPYA